jgi:hypothetical protein
MHASSAILVDVRITTKKDNNKIGTYEGDLVLIIKNNAERYMNVLKIASGDGPIDPPNLNAPKFSL